MFELYCKTIGQLTPKAGTKQITIFAFLKPSGVEHLLKLHCQPLLLALTTNVRLGCERLEDGLKIVSLKKVTVLLTFLSFRQKCKITKKD